MGERRSQRFRLGRRRDRQPAAVGAEPEAPCLPCAKQASLRQFALNLRTVDRVHDDFVPSLDPEVADTITGGEVVLFDRRAGSNTLLNSSAALIWASIDGRSSVATITDDLVSETGADRDVIASDVRATLARFVDGGVVLDTLPPPAGADADEDELAPQAGGDAAAAAMRRARDERRDRLVGAVLARRAWQLDEVRRCAGAAVAIRTDSVELAALLGPALAPLTRAEPTDAVETLSILDRRGGDSLRRFRLVVGTEALQVATTPEQALAAVFAELNDLAINRTPDRVVLHAGAVERDGAIVVVAGPSGRGKSTVTAALIQAGWRYLTDEVVAVDPATRGVLPYPKPLDLGPASRELLGIDAIASSEPKAKVAIDRLGVVGDGTGHVELLVLLDDPTSSAPPQRSPAEVLVEVLGNTFASTFEHVEVAQQALDQVVALIEAVPVMTLERRPAPESVRAITEHLGDVTTTAPVRSHRR